MDTTETCPHCGLETTLKGVDEGCMTAVCAGCGKAFPMCNRCDAMHGGVDSHHCDDCPVCDLANYMNYLRGKVTVENLLASLNPPLTDMTTEIPDGKAATLEDYLNDAYGDDVNWDVKYWDAYRMVKESFLNANSPESDCREFVERLLEFNAK